jgi:acyl dehydratase
MPNNDALGMVDVDLQPQATQAARKYINQFAVTLIMQAKAIAFSRRADGVLPAHVDEALAVLNKLARRSWLSEFAVIIGSLFFGVFLQGFVSNLPAGNTLLIASYTAIGFVGIFLAFWGLRR